MADDKNKKQEESKKPATTEEKYGKVDPASLPKELRGDKK